MMISIDGPAATGKSVVGRLLAKRLGYKFLDTGIMYRAVTWLAMKDNICIGDWTGLTALANETVIWIDYETGQIYLNGLLIPLSEERDSIDKNVSRVSAVPGVRKVLTKHQQVIGNEGSIVMVGRDIGTVVLPHASVKFFLIASDKERARRRYTELKSDGFDVEENEVFRAMEERDKLDSERAQSPLTPAKDAYIVDTDGLDIEEVVYRMTRRIRE
ncbi:uncharacterized protein METZ01_LOCUS355878, partial [marine metagenome]|jgi:cytidylate kinase